MPPPNEDIRYIPTILGGVDYSVRPHGLLFVHANAGITFDLEAIRQANPDRKLKRFLAVAANTEIYSRLSGKHNSADIWVFVDGQERFKQKNINSYSGPAPIAVSISDQNRYLTIVSTDGGNGIGGDWIIFGDPRIEMTGGDAKAVSDRVINTSQPARPKGEGVRRK